jgi:hypothetical protein
MGPSKQFPFPPTTPVLSCHGQPGVGFLIAPLTALSPNNHERARTRKIIKRVISSPDLSTSAKLYLVLGEM